MRAFLSDLWSQRGFRYTFVIGLSIAAFVTCFYWVLNWSGEKRWQRVKAKLEAEGESFDFYSLYPAPIADEQNFCAIEALNGIRTPEGTSPEAVAAQKKREEIKKQTAFLMIQSAFSIAGYSTHLADWVLPVDTFIGETFDAEERLEKIYNAGAFHVTTEIKSWSNVQQAVEKQAPLLGQMAAVVDQRVHADFLPRQTREGLPKDLYRIPTVHLNSVQPLSNLLCFHGTAAIQAHEGQMALRDIQSLLRLAEGTDSTLTFIGNVMGAAIRSRAIQLTWALTESQFLQESQLGKLQNEWERCNVLTALMRAVRSEMIMQVDSITVTEDNPNERWFIFAPTSGPPIASPKFAGLYNMIPRGLATHSKSALLEFEYRYILNPRKLNGLQGCIENVKTMEAVLNAQTGWQHFDMIVTRSCAYTYNTLTSMAAYGENQRRQAVLACALERHILRHGSYPETLDSLDSEIRGSSVLFDVNENVMHYLLVPGGRFRLWSSGPDGKDDGGKFRNELITSAYKSKSPYQRNYIGDWVWRYDPAVKVP